MCCGHIYHSQCLKKFERESEIVLRVCFTCKADYAKIGTLKLKPLYQPVQLDVSKGAGEDFGVGEHKSDIKALKTEIKNLKAQIKKDAKISAEQQKSAVLKEQMAKNKIRRLVTGVKDLNTSMMKFCDASDFEKIDDEATIVVAEVQQQEIQQPPQVSTRSRGKDNTTHGTVAPATDSSTADTETEKENKKKDAHKTVGGPKPTSRSGKKK